MRLREPDDGDVRPGRGAKVIDLLVNPQTSFRFADARLSTRGPYPYFPSNGWLLYAIAMRAGGSAGAPADEAAPGFPVDGWVVRAEGIARAV